ncbi:hypothetical protein ACHAXT_006335 [Thalassiosira profunda]
MDFGRPLTKTAGVVSRSGIRLVDETHLGNDPLDVELCRAANDAARALFLGNDHPSRPPLPVDGDEDDGDECIGGGASEKAPSDGTAMIGASEGAPINQNDHLANCSLYDEQHLPPARRLIQPNDLVVVFNSFDDLSFVYATPNDVFSNRNGHFHHNDFIGKPFGCKIRSKNHDGLGFLYLLRPTPELWARSLPHRTQIVHELDASMIVHYLNLCPNMTVCESGTGSGAMSHAIMRSIAPKGKLHTYEFNKMRVGKARKEFEGHGLGHLVECHHRDVCGKKALLLQSINADATHGKATAMAGGDASDKTDEPGSSVDDECEEEEDDGMGGFQLGQAAAHAIFLDLPEPWLAVPHAAYAIKPNGRIGSYSPCIEQTQQTAAALRRHGFHSIRTVEARLKEYFVSEVEMEAPPTELPVVITEEISSLEKERQKSSDGVLPVMEQKMKDAKREESERAAGAKRKVHTVLCARPFREMRGHTAFLTFATAGNAPLPDPNGA